MNHALIPSTVAAPARTTKIQRLSCTSGHRYRRRVSRTMMSVPAMEVPRPAKRAPPSHWSSIRGTTSCAPLATASEVERSSQLQVKQDRSSLLLCEACKMRLNMDTLGRVSQRQGSRAGRAVNGVASQLRWGGGEKGRAMAIDHDLQSAANATAPWQLRGAIFFRCCDDATVEQEIANVYLCGCV